MSKKRKLDPVWGWMYFLFGLTAALDITLDPPYDGFFLKETYNKNDVPDPNKFSKTFIINQPSEMPKIKAQNGPFESHQTISKNLLDTVYSRNRKNSSLMHRSVVFNMDVSAHIVTKDISPKVPRLQVLVHASPQHKSNSNPKSQQRWCAQIFAEADNKVVSAVCVLNVKNKVCVTGLNLHKEWWSDNGTSVHVSYSFTGIYQNGQCASASNALIPEKTLSNNSESGVIKQEISTLHLQRNEKSFDEWKDQDILIDVPREIFHHSDSFEIPIRLEQKSDLQIFVMRARVRQGLRITGARMSDPSSQWSIQVDIKEHQKTGTITAFVRDPDTYKKSANVEDVFRWQMEVAEDTYDTRDMGRVVWSIEYQHKGVSHDTYLSQDSKIVSQINIRSKDQQRLVPVLKVTEIVNVAVMTDRKQEYPLRIYAVDDTEKYTDVTKQTKCHSVEVDVLKVASDCTSVYVDGAESRGSHNVTIIVKSGHTTAFMDIAVWVPEERPYLQLSDDKLSRVRKWRVPSGSTRNKRSLDPFLTDKSGSQHCELQRQQSVVEVYTRFYIQTPKQTDYFMGPGSFLKVTDLVKSRLRIADTRIAVLEDNIIKGKEKGRTEIQLMSPRTGHVLAVKEIHVSHDKVNITRLDLKLITGMTLFVEPSPLIGGALVATVIVDGQFLSNHQEGIVDVNIVYSDMTSLPLGLVSPTHYFLEAQTLDINILGVVATSVNPYQPHIVAKGEGSKEVLKVELKLGKTCARRNSNPLSSDTMYMNVDFSQERKIYDASPFQSDAHFDTNRASDRWDKYDKKPAHLFTKQSDFEDDNFPESKFSKIKASAKDGLQFLQANEDDFDDFLQKDKVGEAKQEPLRTKTNQGLSPLEIGMYVLLVVFCVGMSVFMINCVVFFVRYKRKQKPHKTIGRDAIGKANDWVWIGRATLERNSLYTRSSRTLMPEEDFNGNVNANNSSRPLSTGSSCSSSSGSSGGSGGSAASTSGVPSGPSTAPNSNRNSTVSTYKGSECSIRITANPLSEEGGAMGGALPEETRSEGGPGGPQWDYEAMGMNYNQLLDYFDNLKESSA